MLAIQKWAEGKPFLLAISAPQLAWSARDIHQGFRHIKERRVFSHQFPLPDLRDWFHLYRSHHKTLNFVRAVLSDFSKFGVEGVNFGDAVFEVFRLFGSGKLYPSDSVSTEEDLKQIRPLLQATLSASFLDIAEDFSGTPPTPSVKAAALQLFTDMDFECGFHMLVLAPSWLLYREHPTRLYRKARRGDLDALEKLLRLDPLMLHDPSIGKRIQALRFTNNTSVYRNLIEASMKRPNARITRKKMKYAIAGLISGLSCLIKAPLTEPDIRALFDAVVQDADGALIDTDIADSPETFAKAINRDRAFWLQALLPDNKM